MIDLDSLDLMTPQEREQVSRAWESCKPKLIKNDKPIGGFVIYGTSPIITQNSFHFNDLFFKDLDKKEEKLINKA